MSRQSPGTSPLDDEALRRTIWFANQLAVKYVPLPLLRRDPPSTEYSSLVESIERLLLESHNHRKLILPEHRAFNNQSLGVLSDYSGEGSGRYLVYSVLVCGFNTWAIFEARTAEIRQRRHARILIMARSLLHQ
jgi:hypothetical protein